MLTKAPLARAANNLKPPSCDKCLTRRSPSRSAESCSGGSARFPVKGPAVGLFADQEIRMIDGPLFVGEDYLIRREIAALSESRRTESYWVRVRIFDAAGKRQLAEVLLNHATLKESYAGYASA